MSNVEQHRGSLEFGEDAGVNDSVPISHSSEYGGVSSVLLSVLQLGAVYGELPYTSIHRKYSLRHIGHLCVALDQQTILVSAGNPYSPTGP